MRVANDLLTLLQHKKMPQMPTGGGSAIRAACRSHDKLEPCLQLPHPSPVADLARVGGPVCSAGSCAVCPEGPLRAACQQACLQRKRQIVQKNRSSFEEDWCLQQLVWGSMRHLQRTFAVVIL